jgi:hypothetical protein|tara:strand:- start:398 stop:559 length:162 start_codon:yes stop_codon:yes gene_type:complete
MSYEIYTTDRNGKNRTLFASTTKIKKALKMVARCSEYSSMKTIEIVKVEVDTA